MSKKPKEQDKPALPPGSRCAVMLYWQDAEVRAVPIGPVAQGDLALASCLLHEMAVGRIK